MSETLPREEGLKHSILQWLDGLGWETYGHVKVSASNASGGSEERSSSGEWGTTVLDREYDRDTSEVTYRRSRPSASGSYGDWRRQ